MTLGESILERNKSFLMLDSTSVVVVADADELFLRLLRNAFLMLGNRFPSNGLDDDGNENAVRTSGSNEVTELEE